MVQYLLMVRHPVGRPTLWKYVEISLHVQCMHVYTSMHVVACLGQYSVREYLPESIIKSGYGICCKNSSAKISVNKWCLIKEYFSE